MISRVSSTLKVVSVQNIISNEIYRAELILHLCEYHNFNYNLFICGEERGIFIYMNLHVHVY